MITTTLTVWCEYCSNWEYLTAVHKRDANKEIKDKGWKMVKLPNEYKHACPECYKRIGFK